MELEESVGTHAFYIQINSYTGVCICVCSRTYTLLSRPTSNSNTAAMSTPHAQILVSKCHPPLKRTRLSRLLRETIDSGPRQGKYKRIVEPVLCQKVKRSPKRDQNTSKRHRSHLEDVLAG